MTVGTCVIPSPSLCGLETEGSVDTGNLFSSLLPVLEPEPWHTAGARCKLWLHVIELL